MALISWWRRALGRSRTPFRRARLRLESIEDRLAPAVFTIANGDITALRDAITASNTNNEADTIDLATNGTYTFNNAFNVAQQLALPVIESDTADSNNSLTINGNGSTFNRTISTLMRFLVADSSATPPTLIVNDLTMNNAASSASGGAVFLGGSNATFTNCKFTNNAGNGGGALVSVSTTNVSLTLTNCEFTNNDSSGVGGAVAVQGTVTVAFDGLNVQSNSSDNNGGGIWVQGADVKISNSIIRGNNGSGATTQGGGIWISGNLDFSNGQVADNTSSGSGAGILCLGNATITSSSLTGNNALNTNSGGGGMAVDGNIEISNSTIDGNRAAFGGGVFVVNLTAGGISQSTITRNRAFAATAEGGGIYNPGTTPLQMDNTIVAQNVFDGSVTAGVGPDIFGPIASQGFNLIGVVDGATITGNTAGNKTGTLASPLDPLLGALANYGGKTLTRPLLPGSPALDAGDPNFLPPPDFDQRGTGFPRVIGGRVDIGSLEAPQVDLTIVKTDNVNSAVPGQKVTYTITVTNKGPQDAIGAVVRDALSSTFLSPTWSAVFSGGATGNASGSGGILETVNIPLNGQVVYSLTATISPSATGSLGNTAFADPPPGYSDPVNDNSSTDTNVLTPIADAFITKVISGTPTPGGTVTYTITVGNTGPSTVTALRLRDNFPAIFTQVSWISAVTGTASGNKAAGNGNIDQTLVINPGSTVKYTINARINPDAPGGTISNTATITPPDSIGDPNIDNNASTNSVLMIVGQQVVAVGADSGSIPVVNVYNPLSGTLRTSIEAYSRGFRGGVRVAVADFNGDGTQDVVTAPGPGGGPHIRVFDGRDGVVLWELFAYDPGFTGGVYVAAGDVNNDGRMDIITGAGAGGGSHVRVWDGLTRFLLAGDIGEFFAYVPSFSGGVRVAVGDVNGDGKDDIITGAGPGGGPHVRAFSGEDRSIVANFFAYGSSFRGGVYVTSGDFNFDGFDDIVTGSGEGGGPHVRFFDGTNGLVFRDLFAYQTNSGGLGSNSVWSSGVRVSAQADVTGDGLDDLYVGPGFGRTSNVRLYSGDGLGLVRETRVFDPAFLGGVFVGGA